MKDELLRIENLSAAYGSGPVLAGLSFSIGRGEIFCLAGESGCGKSTLLKALMGIEPALTLTGGRIELDGADLTALPPKAAAALRRDKLGMIFQDPGASFDPLRTYRAQFRDALRGRGLYRKERFEAEAGGVFARLGLEDAPRLLASRPFELSGGMKQRMAIALALLSGCSLLLADEPTAALDAAIRLQAAQELKALRETGLSLLVVTHDLGLAHYLADRVGVVYAGRLVELGEAEAVFTRPLHPYTKSLLAALPSLGGELPKGLEGRPPAGPAPLGCELAPRCLQATPACAERCYALQEIEPGHYSACCGTMSVKCEV